MTSDKATPATVNINAVAAPTPARPGISESSLKAAGIRRVTAAEAQQLIGYPQSGILIPFHNLDGSPLLVEGRPFYRLRTDTQDAIVPYLPVLTSCREVYIPPDILSALGKTLYIVDGEFKALALRGAGIPAVSVNGAARMFSTNPDGGRRLREELSHFVFGRGVAEIVYIGDRGNIFNPDFADDMLSLAKILPVHLKVFPFPVSASGRGIDDLIESLGTDFPAKWYELTQKMEVVDREGTVGDQAWRFLNQEVDAIVSSKGKQRELFQKNLVGLAARFTDNALLTSRITDVATELGLSLRAFNNAVKAERTHQIENAWNAKMQGAENPAFAAEQIYYDGTHYYRCFGGETWDTVTRPDVQLHLSMQGLSKMGALGEPSPVEKALYAIQQKNRVDYAGRLCGRRAGYVVENGYRFLVTQSPRFITGVAGDYPRLHKILSDLFGVGPDHPQGATQLAMFMGWLKLARKALLNPNLHLPAQVLAFVGPHDCGKSFIIEHMISPGLGGRVEDATAFFLDKTEFNANLWAAELLIVGDKGLGDSARDRAKLRDSLKKAVAEKSQGLRFMHRNPLTMRPIWRIVLAANDSAENISDLPTLDASFADKIIYLKCFMPSEPLFQAEVPGAREALTTQISDELPAFLYAVDNYEIPANLVKGRFGITEWHHPDIVDALNTSSHLQPVAEAIHKWIRAKFEPNELSRTLSSSELYDALSEVYDGRLPRQTCSGALHMGKLLASLSESPNWQGLVERGNRRLANNQKQTVWTITKPDGEDSKDTQSVSLCNRKPLMPKPDGTA